MSIPLSDELRQALDAQPDEPLRLVDPRTNAAYVLLPADVYERVKGLLEEEDERALRKAWLDAATKARRAWVQENPY
jgi:hypothetical protein